MIFVAEQRCVFYAWSVPSLYKEQFEEIFQEDDVEDSK
jgi:hypothetical protein